MTSTDELEAGVRWAVEEALADSDDDGGGRRHRRSPAQPRFCTPRNPDRPTLGHELVDVIRMLGFEPMPWQELVADIALELDADGDLVYREVVLIVPRQSGKTVLLLALRVWRALKGAERWGRGQTTVYTAQTRNDAVKKFVDDEMPVVKGSPFGRHFRERKGIGKEGGAWRNGSRHYVEPTTKKAGHGKSVDLGEIDEAFAVPDDRVESGIGPTMITRRSPQMWIVSAIGDDSDEAQPSAWLWSKVEAGRARVAMVREALEAGRPRPSFSSAYFEWSAREDADPADPETWWSCMPALGITQSEKAVRAEYENRPRRVFKRAYLCIWPGSRTQPRLVPEAEWRSERHLEADPRAAHAQFVGDLVLAVDASPGLGATSLVVAGRRADGAPQVEVVKRADGSTWAPLAIAKLVHRHRCTVVMSKQSPAAAMLPELARVDIGDGVFVSVKVEELATDEVFRACEAWLRAFTEGNARHLGQSALDVAVDQAVKKPYGARFSLEAAEAGGDVSPLRASALALWRALSPAAGPVRIRFI